MTRPDRHAAFVAHVREHEGMLRRLVSVYARGEEDRRDLLQDMLTQLWRAFPGYRGEARFSTWMYRVALNTALMGRRALARRPEGHLASTPDPLDAMHEPARASDQVRALYAAIRTLPELDRAIVALWLEGHTYPEIAEITGLGRSNVSVRLVRAKNELRERLTDDAATKEATR